MTTPSATRPAGSSPADDDTQQEADRSPTEQVWDRQRVQRHEVGECDGVVDEQRTAVQHERYDDVQNGNGHEQREVLPDAI